MPPTTSVLPDAQACLTGRVVNYTMPWIDLSVRRMLAETSADPPTWSRACCKRHAKMCDQPGCCGLPTVRAGIWCVNPTQTNCVIASDFRAERTLSICGRIEDRAVDILRLPCLRQCGGRLAPARKGTLPRCASGESCGLRFGVIVRRLSWCRKKWITTQVNGTGAHMIPPFKQYKSTPLGQIWRENEVALHQTIALRDGRHRHADLTSAGALSLYWTHVRYVARGGPHVLLLEMDAVLLRGFAHRLRMLFEAAPPLRSAMPRAFEARSPFGSPSSYHRRFDVCVFGPVALFSTPFGEGRMNELMDEYPASVVLEDSGALISTCHGRAHLRAPRLYASA